MHMCDTVVNHYFETFNNSTKKVGELLFFQLKCNLLKLNCIFILKLYLLDKKVEGIRKPQHKLWSPHLWGTKNSSINISFPFAFSKMYNN